MRNRSISLSDPVKTFCLLIGLSGHWTVFTFLVIHMDSAKGVLAASARARAVSKRGAHGLQSCSVCHYIPIILAVFIRKEALRRPVATFALDSRRVRPRFG